MTWSSFFAVLATARRPEQLADLVERYGASVRTAALDVTDAAAARDAVAAAVAEFGRLDVVVNNAGYANSAPIEEMAEEGFRAQFEANFFGVVNNGTQPGDPARVAQVIIDVLDHAEPPRRLLLGAQAVTSALAAGEARTEEARKWAEVSGAADFPAGE